MKKINKQTSKYISNAIKFYTDAHQTHIEDSIKEGKNPFFTVEYFDQFEADALRDLERVTRKK